MTRFYNLTICIAILSSLSVSAFSKDDGIVRKGNHEVELSVSVFTDTKSDLQRDIDYWNTMYKQYVENPFTEHLPEYAIPSGGITSVPYIGVGYKYRILNWLALGADFHYGFGTFPLQWSTDGREAWNVDYHNIRLLFSARFYWFSSPLVELFSELSLGTSVTRNNSPFDGLSIFDFPSIEAMTPVFNQSEWETKTRIDYDIRILGITIGKDKGIYGKIDGGVSAYNNGYLRVGLGYRF